MFGFGKPSRPKAIAFDIIGTSFPLEPLRADIVGVGLPPAVLETWFSAALRDAFALAAAGDFAPFAEVLEAALTGLMVEWRLPADTAEIKAIVKRLSSLPARDGLDKAFRAVANAGCTLIALSNGSTASTTSLLEGAGLRSHVNHIISADELKLSKPRAEVYQLAAQTAGVKPAELALIAVHPWDINGGKAAGLITAYLSADGPFSSIMRKPDVTGDRLSTCVDQLLAL